MKGSNTLDLNQATVIEALQEWADKHLADKVKVTGVKKKEGYQMGNSFEVQLLSEEEEQP